MGNMPRSAGDADSHLCWRAAPLFDERHALTPAALRALGVVVRSMVAVGDWSVSRWDGLRRFRIGDDKSDAPHPRERGLRAPTEKFSGSSSPGTEPTTANQTPPIAPGSTFWIDLPTSFAEFREPKRRNDGRSLLCPPATPNRNRTSCPISRAMNAAPLVRRPLGCLKASLRQTRQQKTFARHMATEAVQAQTQTTPATSRSPPQHDFCN